MLLLSNHWLITILGGCRVTASGGSEGYSMVSWKGQWHYCQMKAMVCFIMVGLMIFGAGSISEGMAMSDTQQTINDAIITSVFISPPSSLVVGRGGGGDVRLDKVTTYYSDAVNGYDEADQCGTNSSQACRTLNRTLARAVADHPSPIPTTEEITIIMLPGADYQGPSNCQISFPKLPFRLIIKSDEEYAIPSFVCPTPSTSSIGSAFSIGDHGNVDIILRRLNFTSCGGSIYSTNEPVKGGAILVTDAIVTIDACIFTRNNAGNHSPIDYSHCY
jgi:hypothetical protein